jgi:protein-S-isoprenylcysteine O-methyltransferase Ste14
MHPVWTILKTVDDMTPTTDSPGVIAPPPMLVAGAGTIGLALHYLIIPISFGFGAGVRFGIGGLLIAAWLWLSFSVIRQFGKAGTHVEPWMPSTRLVTSGVYAYTRNPMYLGMALCHIGVSLMFDSVTVMLFLVPLVVVMRYGVIGREERYLTAKFPVEYPEYQRRVRRWI